ncbi:endonuclease V-like [Gadus macrocephalus]|uniref:endonuclease V-like n=1 Tax=Gadus macrocephalus TaxID=80720 RepID=UPI0028CB44A0|nr:endonuclease V-like [Gadus macrocephalus]
MSVVCDDEVVKRWEREQASLRQRVVEEDTEAWQRCPRFSTLERVGGVDLSFIKGDEVNACAQLVVLSYPDLEVLYEDSQMVRLTAPYVAGFLAFRETPFLLEALRRLERNRPQLLPQVVLVDGNGLFHYREFGLACHLGVLSGIPSVGVAKNLLQVQGVTKSEEHQSQVRASPFSMPHAFLLLVETERVNPH